MHKGGGFEWTADGMPRCLGRAETEGRSEL